MKFLVVAPAGAGKTTFVKKLGIRGIDADLFPAVREVYKKLGAEFGPKWWDIPEHKAFKERELKLAFNKLFTSMRPGQAVFTAESDTLDYVPRSFKRYVVVPTLEDFERNHASRRRDPSQRFNWTSTEKADLQKQLDRYHDRAVKHKAVEVSNFGELFKQRPVPNTNQTT